MLCKLYVLAICAIYAAHAQSVTLTPFKSQFDMAEGSTLEVKCESENSVEWLADPPSAMPAKSVKAETSGDIITETLKLERLTKDNQGTFRCVDSTTNTQASFKVNVFSVDKSDNATFEYKVDIMLECQITDISSPITYSWRKGDVDVKDIVLENKEAYTVHKNGSLEITHPSRKMAGNYTCVADFEANGEQRTVEIYVPYYATPKVLPFEKSKNLVQGENLVVVCQVLGYPKPVVSWMKGDKKIMPDDERAKLGEADSYNGQSIDNAKLTVKEVDFDDAGEYRCIAQHRQWRNFNSSQPVLVRVKDKLAALWPFLGIVVEVIILCTIIFIYEKKRNKDAVVEEDDDQQGNTTAKQADNVRHRGNTNNPRA